MQDERNKDFTGLESGSRVSVAHIDQFTASLQSAKPIPGRVVEVCRGAATFVAITHVMAG
jgi:hypothetical protein